MARATSRTRQAAQRLQANLTVTSGSPLHARIANAERLTGRSATQIVRAVVEHHLEEWLRGEVERQRSRDAGPLGIRIVDAGAVRPRYRADEGPDADYAGAVALRVPVAFPASVTTKGVALVDESARPRLRNEEGQLTDTPDQ